MSEDREEPQIVYIDANDKPTYDMLSEKGGPLEGMDNKDMFLLAMALGYMNNIKVELKDRLYFFRTSYLDNHEKALLKAIAVSEEGSLDVLSDKKKIYSLAEQYATGGLKLLRNIAFEKFGKDLYKKLLPELSSKMEKG
jgi:hypothetical protein